jgi:hypothetical protein
MVPRRCSVQEFSFAAHVDGTENREFIEGVAAPVVVGSSYDSLVNPRSSMLTNVCSNRYLSMANNII